MNKPQHSVRIVVFREDAPNLFLIITEADDPHNWKLPGGSFHSADEPPLAAAQRELLEELQLTPQQTELQARATLRNDDGVSARYIFSATVALDAIQPSEEISQLRWVSVDAIPAGKNAAHIRSAYNAAIKRQ